MWKGNISFGMVTIPVRLYSATENKDIRLHFLHETCMAPVRYQKVCGACGKPAEDIVLGYEVDDGAYVALKDEELESLGAGSLHSMDIMAFVNIEEVDPVFFDKSYFVEAQTGGQKAYALLRAALAQRKRAALARIVLRRKDHLAILRPFKALGLIMETLHDADEVRDLATLDLPEGAIVDEKELGLALMLIDALAAPFEPNAEEDRYRTALRELISAKVAGQQTVLRVEPAAPPVADLLTALRASLNDIESREHAPVH